MFESLTHSFGRQPKLPFYLGWILLIPVLIFSVWLLWAFNSSLRFRDRLFEKEYEGSLSTELGLLVALTSEASQRVEARPTSSQAIQRALKAVREELSGLSAISPSRPSIAEVIDLATAESEEDLRRLLADPKLSDIPLSRLGLELGTRPGFPAYPFLQSTGSQGPATSFVFIPASGVQDGGAIRTLSLSRRRDLVFSRLAELKLRPLFTDIDSESIVQAYYIACSDFVRMVFPRPMPGPSFSAFRSFVDRTYFRETLASKDGLRESALYLDVTGSGFVITHSAFVHNETVGLCGLLAVDVKIQSLADFWQQVTLGGEGGGLRDFSSATLVLPERRIESGSSFSEALRTEIEAEVKEWPAEDLQGGIKRMNLGSTKVFTVPIGGGRVGLFSFNEAATRRKYFLILVFGALSIISFVIMVAYSASRQRAAAEAEQLQNEILENLHGGFAIVDRAGNIRGATERFRMMVGNPAGVPPVEGFLSRESTTEYRKLASGESFSFAGNLHRPGRADEPVIVASAPVSLPGEPGARMLILIPSRELEVTIAGKFLNVFSHALKSPVHSILLIADLFRRRNALPRFDEYYSQLYRKVQEFRTLTDNVLRFSALDVKAIQPERNSVNVARVLRQVLSSARERARARGLALHESIPASLQSCTDSQLLVVVVNNLVDNALKYTNNGHIAVHAVDLLTRIQITVEDSGPGVPASERDSVFDLFVQGSSATRVAHEGLGLGLHISRRYMEALGGTLRYEPILRDPRGPDDETNLAGSRLVAELPKGG